MNRSGSWARTGNLGRGVTKHLRPSENMVLTRVASLRDADFSMPYLFSFRNVCVWPVNYPLSSIPKYHKLGGMKESFRVLSASAQVARHLREGIRSGVLRGTLPGENRLVAELGVGRDTVKAALQMLEDEGLLRSLGQGRRREIVARPPGTPPGHHIALLFAEAINATQPIPMEIVQSLRGAGHTIHYADKTLRQMRNNPAQVSGLLKGSKTDAWVVFFAPRSVLEWFEGQRVPCLAVAGRHRQVPIAAVAPEKVPAFRQAVRRLVDLGHRRIVLIAREMRRKPKPGMPERAFLDELKAQGLPSGSFNLPDWDDDAHGLRDLLESLFRTTPPTALLVSTPELFDAVQIQLSRWGLNAPEDVSLICTDYHNEFEWRLPEVSHLVWDSRPLVRRVVKWADNVRLGREDRRKTYTTTRFIEGGTIGPAPRDDRPGVAVDF